MPTTMKPLPLTDVTDIGEIFQIYVVLEMTSVAWIKCFLYGTVVL